MSYFGRIASRGSGAPGAGLLAQPALRSASPLAEFDQRFHLTSESGEPALDTATLSVGPAEGEAGIAVEETAGFGADATPARARAAFEPGPRFRAFGASQATTAADVETPRADPAFHAREPTGSHHPTLDLGSVVVSEIAGPDRVVFSGSSLITPGSVALGEVATSGAPVTPSVPAPGTREALLPAESASFPQPVRAPAESASLPQPVRAPAGDIEARAPEPARKPAEAEPSNQLSALAGALSKVEAWMRQPSAQAAASAEPAPTIRVSEQRAARSVPKLVIGHVEVEVIAPKEPPQRPARRPRAAPAAAAARPAPSVLAKQSFGARQR